MKDSIFLELKKLLSTYRSLIIKKNMGFSITLSDVENIPLYKKNSKRSDKNVKRKVYKFTKIIDE